MIGHIVSLVLTTTLAQSPCESLKTLALSHTTITTADLVPGGPFAAPGQTSAQNAPSLPAHCRVAAVLAPSHDSHIEMEVWMPAAGWNGKYMAVGNGGWAGSISYSAMAAALQEGYATASTDTGHKGGDAVFSLGHPEKLIDFGYRAVHETTVKAKAFIGAFYGQAPRLSYWNGCSTGGRQGLMSAQRYPEDFDAIIAGAPANYQTHLHAGDMARGIGVIQANGAFTPAKLATLNNAVVNACDAIDGVADGLIDDPRRCSFDPAALLCQGGDSDDCLTAAQVEAARIAYSATTTRTGELIFPGYERGSESSWGGPLRGASEPVAIAVGTFRYATYQDENWDWRTFNLERDTAMALEEFGYVNAIDPDLQAFKARGGKLLLYHGWNDTAISPQNSVNYYESVLEKMGADQDDWIRLFMAPGMGHCSGGVGPNQVHYVAALERWRESGNAPDRLTAYRVTNNRVDMTRPLCPYPQIARYTGSGSTNDAENFVCSRP